MRYIWSVLCKRAIIDNGTKKLSVIDIPEVIRVVHLPPPEPGSQKYALSFGLTLVSDFWYDENGPSAVEVRFLWRMPGGDRMDLGSQSYDASKTKLRNTRVRLLLEIPIVEYRGLGIYDFEIEMKVGKKWHRVASHPLTVALDDSASPILLEPPSAQTDASLPEST